MSIPEESAYTIALADIDRNLLPEELRTAEGESFADAVKQFITEQYAELGGEVRVVIDHAGETVSVRWNPHGSDEHPLQGALRKLNAGRYEEGVQALELLRFAYPDDPALYYNLGIALSELGRYAEAQEHLSRTLELEPSHVNAAVGLGIAQARSGKLEDAITTLRTAVSLDEANPWAHKNLAALLMEQGGELDQSRYHFSQAVSAMPGDQQSLYGMSQVLLKQGKTAEAAEYLKQTIAVAEHTHIAEMARRDRTKIAETEFRAETGSTERMDAVMYCMDAIKRFQTMSEQEVRDVGVEIAVLGQQGLNTNDSSKTYTLRSLEGDYTALNLVCMLYVAFQQIAPGEDVGFDLAKEYAVARKWLQVN